jgi:hypothetical protein
MIPGSANNIAVAPSITANDKLDCCHACSKIFNCVWWKFDFGDSSNNPGTPGTCTFAYHTGANGNFGQVPAICPNGMLSTTQWYDGSIAAYGYPNTEFAFYGTGYNPGACSGGALNLFESDFELSLPPDYASRICPGQNMPI